jgi:hypothetical protein
MTKLEDDPDIEELEAGSRILDDLYAKALTAIAASGAPATSLTGDDIARQIGEKLEPHFGHMTFHVDRQNLGNQDGVYVTYASVPKGSAEIDALNARSNPMISIYKAPGTKWPQGEAAPAKLVTEMFRGSLVRDKDHGSALKFRKKTAEPQKIVDYIVKFFLDNKDKLLLQKDW